MEGSWSGPPTVPTNLDPVMLYRLEFRAMGCEMLAAIDAETRPALLSKVPEWFEEWEQTLSRFRFDSELMRLNQTRGRPVNVSETLWDVLQIARRAEELTDGLVTPSLLDAIIEAGYDRPFDMLPHQTTHRPIPNLTTALPMTAITIDERNHTVTLPAGLSLDLGGVAKGWAAHQAMKRLQAEGPALMNAGGDIAISGSRADGSPWPIGITNPFKPTEEIEILLLQAGGVATSGKDRRRWIRNGVLQHHIIDPVTNQPAATDLLTVTVIAPDVMEAEAMAKATFILGSRAGLEWIEARSQLAALFTLDNGQVLYSHKMEEFL
jgi:thiamine biosynthesis lipoprotein